MRFASVNRIRRLDVVGHWFLRDKCWAPMMRFSYEAYMPDPRLQTLEYAVGVTWH
jgi:hypothetical protein